VNDLAHDPDDEVDNLLRYPGNHLLKKGLDPAKPLIAAEAQLPALPLLALPFPPLDPLLNRLPNRLFDLFDNLSADKCHWNFLLGAR
jgi:hypothetical protein